jgi:DNA helicase-2/ATP-dependent DNA helicase PcrA
MLKPGDAGEEVRRAALAQGWLEQPPEKLGEREQTRQADLARLVRLAEQFEGDALEFAASLRERFGASAARGVHLLTLHRAKGLEFEAVHLPRVEEGELPSRRAKGDDVEEERRLLYVGLTRAKRHLLVTWTGKPSRFLEELGVRSHGPAAAAKPKQTLEQTPAVLALKEWRLARARAEEVPAYVVFNDRTLAELVARSPTTLAELAAVPGIGPAKLERFGAELLAAVARAA